MTPIAKQAWKTAFRAEVDRIRAERIRRDRERLAALRRARRRA